MKKTIIMGLVALFAMTSQAGIQSQIATLNKRTAAGAMPQNLVIVEFDISDGSSSPLWTVPTGYDAIVVDAFYIKDGDTGAGGDDIQIQYGAHFKLGLDLDSVAAGSRTPLDRLGNWAANKDEASTDTVTVQTSGMGGANGGTLFFYVKLIAE